MSDEAPSPSLLPLSALQNWALFCASNSMPCTHLEATVGSRYFLSLTGEVTMAAGVTTTGAGSGVGCGLGLELDEMGWCVDKSMIR